MGHKCVNWTEARLDALFEKQLQTSMSEESDQRKELHEYHRLSRLWRGPGPDPLKEANQDRQARKREIIDSRERILSDIQVRNEFLTKQHYDVLKTGVKEGKIEIEETPDGFRILTPPEQVEKYVNSHNRTESKSQGNIFLDGQYLLDAFKKPRYEWLKNNMANLQKTLRAYAGSTPTASILSDIVAADTIRFFQAIQQEIDLTQDASERFANIEAISERIAPYIDACHEQLLKSLQYFEKLKVDAPEPRAKHLTQRQYNETKWGEALVQTLVDLSLDRSEEFVGISEIKRALRHRLPNARQIENAEIGYALTHYGLTKIHTESGNSYKIDRSQILAILKTLKA